MSLSAEVLKLVPADDRKAFARNFLVLPEPKMELQFRPAPLSAPHLPPQVNDETREISMRFLSGQDDELTALEKLFLALLKLPSQMPLQDPVTESVSTMHEGRVKYVPMWNFLCVRTGRRA